jgi:hypothetical protein
MCSATIDILGRGSPVSGYQMPTLAVRSIKSALMLAPLRDSFQLESGRLGPLFLT